VCLLGIDGEKIRMLLGKIRRMHPSMHAKDTKTIESLVLIIDSYIEEHGKSRDVLIEVGDVLNEIINVSNTVYNAMVSRSRYKALYPVSISLARWHKRISRSPTYGFWSRLSRKLRKVSRPS